MKAYAPGPVMADTNMVLALSASYRHAVMNHLQVVLGWLQLGQPTKAEEYIRILEAGLAGETRLMRAAQPDLAATLVLRRGRAEEYGIELNFDVADGLRSFGWDVPETGRLIGALIDGAILLLDRSPAGRRLDIHLHEEGALRRLTVKLHDARPDAEVVLGLVQEVLAQSGAARDVRPVFDRLTRAGGSWACYEETPVGVVSLAWPKTG